MSDFIDLQGSIIIPAANKMTGKVTVAPAGDSDLSCSITVNAVANLNSTINVQRKAGSDLTASIRVPNRNDLSSMISIVQAGRAELAGSITIPPNSRMTGKVAIIAVGDSDLPSSVTANQVSDLASSVTVNVAKEKDLNTSIIVPFHRDLPTSISVVTGSLSQIDSSISVPPNSRVIGVVDVTPIKRTVLKIQPNRDAFVREGQPTFNYGSNQTMIVGRAAADTERYRTLFGFDLSSVPSLADYEVESAVLKLYTNTINSQTSILDLSKAYGEWFENSVTWYNQPTALGTIGSAVAGDIKDYITFDVSQQVLRWLQGTDTNDGFILKARDETAPYKIQINARENPANQPILEITYIEIPRSPGRLNLPGNITARQSGHLDLPTTVNVFANLAEANIASSIQVKDPDYLLCSITVSRPNIPSVISVRRRNSSQLPSTLSILSEQLATDLASSITVRPTPDDLISSITVVHSTWAELTATLMVSFRADLSSTVSVRVNRDSDLPSSIVAKQQSSLETSITVYPNNKLPSSVTVRGGGANEITGSLTVPVSNRMPGEVVVLPLYNGQADLPASLDINSPYIASQSVLNSSLVVQPVGPVQTYDVAGSVTVLYHNKMTGKVVILIPADMDSLITVQQRAVSDLQSGITVIQQKVVDLPSSIAVPAQNKMTGKMDIIPVGDADLPISIGVQRTAEADLPSTIEVRRTNKNLPSSIIIRHKTELPSQVIVPAGGRMTGRVDVSPVAELPTEIIIPNRKDLPGEIDVIGASMLPMSIQVQSPFLHSSIIIPAYDKKDLTGSITARVTWNSEIPSRIRIRGEKIGGAYAFIM